MMPETTKTVLTLLDSLVVADDEYYLRNQRVLTSVRHFIIDNVQQIENAEPDPGHEDDTYPVPEELIPLSKVRRVFDKMGETINKRCVSPLGNIHIKSIGGCAETAQRIQGYLCDAIEKASLELFGPRDANGKTQEKG